MTLLSSLPAPERRFDCCVVGAGPVGLSLALEAAQRGLSVLLLDAGTRSAQGSRDAPAHSAPAHVVDAARHAPMDQTTRRGVGGTSWLWGGRCVQFEAIDFEPRAYVPASGWPISADDVLPWQAAAAAYLDCGGATFWTDSPEWAGLGEIRMSQLERWARQPKLGPRLGSLALAHPRIALLCEAMVNDIVFDSDGGAVDHLQVRHGGRMAPVRAGTYAAACGGLENTRLLLNVQRRMPDRFGGVDGALGRYYMGHLTGSVANIELTDPEDVSDLDFRRDEQDSYVRRRFTLSEDAQREQRLLNISFYVDNPPFYDPLHRNATLSLVLLALAVPGVGRRILAEGIRLRHIGPTPRGYRRHLLNVARAPWRAMIDALDILRRRYLSPVRKPGFVLRNAAGTYALQYHAEQIPNPNSRVWLNDTVGADGLPCLDIDFRYVAQDVDSVLRSHAVLDRRLRAAGRGHISYLDPEEQRADAVLEQATDGFHHIGTTRMSTDPKSGVVDSDCRVHGVSNLYIASSSVFPTAGEANPTFLAVCLALRLAHHLAMLATAPEDVARPAAAVIGSEPAVDP